ncbi:MAG TPA: hypothetical protein DD417_02405 [Elusimicrobia bacterium]|nr:hypothetical protein [Elusimicrobiota bacterium]
MGSLDQKLNILIADDKEHARALLEERLHEIQGWDILVQCAKDATEALDALRRRVFDVAFIDYLVPGIDGVKLLDQVRQLHPKVAVVIMAPHGSEKIAVDAMKHGAIDFLVHDDLPIVDLGRLLRRAVELQILQSENLELRQVNRMKDEFISSVSHELRTPLAVILGYAKTLREGDLGPVSEPQARALQAIMRRGDLLLQMLNRLLTFRDRAFNTQEVLLRSVDLSPLLGDYLGERWLQNQPRGVRVSLTVPEGPVWALVDPLQLKEVLGSLLSNAVRFSPDSGLVQVTLEEHAGVEAWVRVSDQGRGIEPEILPRLFDGFVHTDSELTREVSGLGIGLALARQIMELHGGRIWLESKGVGQGTSSMLALPLAQPDSLPMAVEQPPRLTKKRVLVVEDNADIVELVRVFLSGLSENLQLTTTHRGEEALDLLRERRFDLLILDLMLPDMNGLELLDRMQKESKERRVPVLILSGHREAAQQAIVRGAQDQLLKPFTKQAFLEKILRLLGLERRGGPRTTPIDGSVGS